MDFRRLFDILPYQEARFANKRALVVRDAIGWKSFSTSQCIQEINKVSAALLEWGMHKGEKAAILTKIGHPTWNFLDFGMQQIGVAVVPLHATSTDSELKHMLSESGVRCCFVADRELFDRIDAIKPQLPQLEGLFTFKNVPDLPNLPNLCVEPSSRHLEEIQALKAAVHEDDLATIIYTAGSTGRPKGVMLSHKNIVSNIKATIALVPIDYRKRALSFLPLSHIFERMVTYA